MQGRGDCDVDLDASSGAFMSYPICSWIRDRFLNSGPLGWRLYHPNCEIRAPLNLGT
jgi:hypothetical protein